ncbi:MAG: RNA methyltransferase [Clostridiales bacterium]|nr:RNA methyltransferase [Clostridiales bacterium]
MKHITSLENSIIKKALSLKQRKAREKEGLYLIEGLHLCKEALGAAEDIQVFFVKESVLQKAEDQDVKDIIEQSQEVGIKITLLSDNVFDKLMDTETPQGISGIVRRRLWDTESFFGADKRKGHGNLLVMDRIQDPGNAGTLIRTAEAAGYQGILVLKGTVDLFSPKVVRSASGSLFRMPVLFTESVKETVELLHSRQKRVIVATPHCDSFHFQVPLDKDVAFVIGNEAGGVSREFLDMSDSHVKIPMSEPVESLNAAVAAGILMYESVRQNFHKEAEEKK